MNIANKVTISRLILIPVFVWSYYFYRRSYDVAAIIFIIASLTDALDGHLARSRNLVTTFGKFVDPLVDKLLTMAAFLVLVEDLIIPGWAVIIIIARELTITGFRTLAADQGVTIAASKWGKAKTFSQMTALVCLLSAHDALNIVGIYIFYIAVMLTLISGIDYIVKNKEILDLENI
ncbi:MAG: CDP-diacylglycerol--glycerol-3-phosphate 3-phosphatidyltransferase [Anaerococcus sp.]|uniref:CDP-diacylglycerol--glycerol-3-phosphate 3-phosphatidyltransferase n=1 Tax=Anaerococcus sp. TaxID=1872515 RepID=UPI00290D6119|nr:CDP-diacylglycerol--glycerol-3-phosphate 3-phosphatidyltransferase [Anaerococcus sp.]MDU4025661.1 CDP-diacylglycerol--glycerol-3-phosphate 3-phosphatidyltransferase [Anaerococcus sp.]